MKQIPVKAQYRKGIMYKFFEGVLKQCTQNDFLTRVRRKYHYNREDMNLLSHVAGEMCPLMQRQALWAHRIFEADSGVRYAEVAMTLGEDIDVLQERYLNEGLLSEAYMVELIGGELLLLGYREYNLWVEKNTALHVARYHFWGGEEAYPLHTLPAILERLSLPIRCNDFFCMLPKKSVAFLAELTAESGVKCEGICVGCNRKECPNRMTDTGSMRGIDMTDRPMPYGYARIFGKEYV